MKKLTLISLMLITTLACKKIPGHSINPTVPSIVPYTIKLGDTVKWVNTINPNPNHKMVVKALYYNDPAKPLIATVLDGSIFHTDSVSKFIPWKP